VTPGRRLSAQVSRAVRLARHPRRALAGLRRRLARGRGRAGVAASAQRPAGSPTASAGREAAEPPKEPGAELAARLVAASATLVLTHDRPVLAVVAGDEEAASWAADAYVQRLRPDDALAVFATATPDALVVHAGAGRRGPWAGLGTYAVPPRDLAVLELVEAARRRGIPSVLSMSPGDPSTPMLQDARSAFTSLVAPDASVEVLAQRPGTGPA
jgi:hypothetical protein